MSDYTTSSTELEDYAKVLKVPLLGVYSKDTLPTKRVGSYIINMEDSDAGNGTHWTLLKIFPNKKVIYFDSFGLPPPRPVREFVGRPMGISNRQIQYKNASTCGLYCLACDHYLTYQRRQKNEYERFDDFLNMFKSEPRQNDRILLEYLRLNGLNISGK
jgi:hypothetical protein